MSSDIDFNKLYGDDTLSKYFPERSYSIRDYKPFGKPFNDLCGTCETYNQFLYDKGLKRTPDTPKCYGHIAKLFDEEIIEELEEEEVEEFMLAADPVAWAKAMFNWEARWYQEEMMSCSALRKVVRAGRRAGKTISVAILALWKMMTLPNQTVLIIAPFEVQVQKIFDEILKFIGLNSALVASVNRNTKNPCRLELNNGSKALGFSSGNQSTAGSDKIRGQDANYIVIDEADYINEIDIEAIMAILASHPDCGLWASSTPTGQHRKFYSFCYQKDLGFKEFWYISAESPSWTAEVEKLFRDSYSATAFEHEFLAEFGIQESGVFRNDLIDQALHPYSLPANRTPGSRVGVGVDWNGQAIGTHIVVVECVQDAQGNIKYRPLEKKIIRGGDYTSHQAVKLIINLYEKYNFDFCYVDAGYGEVQVEMLHKYGRENPKTMMHKKVVAYHMSKSVEIKDPATGITIKKNAKPFMVNSAAIQLEQGRVILPQNEDTSITADTMEGQESGASQGLVQQMRNFSIERISSTGLPTYSQGEDHTLTAWMLALTGFVLEFSDLRKTNNIVQIEKVGQPGQSLEETEDHANVRMAETIRQLDAGVKLPKNSNMGSIGKAIQQGEKLKEAFEAGNKQLARNYFSKSRTSRTDKLSKMKRGSLGKGNIRKTF